MVRGSLPLLDAWLGEHSPRRGSEFNQTPGTPMYEHLGGLIIYWAGVSIVNVAHALCRRERH